MKNTLTALTTQHGFAYFPSYVRSLLSNTAWLTDGFLRQVVSITHAYTPTGVVTPFERQTYKTDN